MRYFRVLADGLSDSDTSCQENWQSLKQLVGIEPNVPVLITCLQLRQSFLRRENLLLVIVSLDILRTRANYNCNLSLSVACLCSEDQNFITLL